VALIFLIFQEYSKKIKPVDILNIPPQIADLEGQKFHTVLDEAFCDYLNKKEITLSDCKVISHFAQSLQEFEDLYKELAN
jgi:hypothetical protein